MAKLLRYKQLFFYAVVALLSVFLIVTDFSSAVPTSQQNTTSSQIYLQGKVRAIESEGMTMVNGRKNIVQEVAIIFEENNEQKEIQLTHGGTRTITEEQKLEVGQEVVIAKDKAAQDSSTYIIWDQYRLQNVYIIVGVFFLLIFLVTGKRGFGAILGLIFSFLVIIKFIVPLIMGGHDPLLISIVGSLIILSVSIYLAHGLTEQTSVAVLSTFLSLCLTGALAVIFVKFVHLSGLGSEDAYTLQFRFTESINFQGLLLGGIIIGALGVLDDVTTTQSATIYELARTDKRLNFRTLVQKGMRVGREHITSLVNTLVLAYAGASIGIFIYILLGLQNNGTPLWVILNSEILVEELVRTLAGSIGLIMAVPITTIIAAFLTKFSIKVT